MKLYFNQNDNNEKDKIIKLSDEINWNDILHSFEEVDLNGEEKEDLEDESKFKDKGLESEGKNLDKKKEEKEEIEEDDHQNSNTKKDKKKKKKNKK